MIDKFCCKYIEKILNEAKLNFIYNPILRSYYIEYKGHDAFNNIDYCPWCGSNFPKELSNEFIDHLSKALKIQKEEVTLEHFWGQGVPKEFKTDEWWKKRGL